MSIYALWRLNENQNENGVDDFISNFCLENKTKLELWGEAAIPQLLAFFWYYRKIDATPAPDFLILKNLISTICNLNKPGGIRPLANPYYGFVDLFSYHLRMADESLEESFQGNSYALEGIVHLLVRRYWKQTIKSLWPDITRLSYMVFQPEEKWHFFRWRNRKGLHKIILPKHTQGWEDLKTQALEEKGNCIPETIKKHPILLLLFLCVYPHRMNSQIIRWLDTKISGI